MYIQPITNNEISMHGKGKPPKNGSLKSRWKNLKQKIVDKLPEITIKDGNGRIDKWNKVNDIISRPAENRLIMGATAILTQPVIDSFNKRVDEDTRTVSRNRTIAKIIAGTSVGILVRGSCYKLIGKLTDINGKNKLNKSLLPKNFLNEIRSNQTFLKNHRSTLSMLAAIIAMCFTNFLLDAPLTVYLTNKLNARSEAQKAKEKEVTNV